MTANATPTERLIAFSLKLTNNQTAKELAESTGTKSIKLLRSALRYMTAVAQVVTSKNRAGVTRYRIPHSPRLYHEVIEDIERDVQTGDPIDELLSIGVVAVGNYLRSHGRKSHGLTHVADLHGVLSAHHADLAGLRTALPDGLGLYDLECATHLTRNELCVALDELEAHPRFEWKLTYSKVGGFERWAYVYDKDLAQALATSSLEDRLLEEAI